MKILHRLNDQARRDSLRPYFENLATDHCIATSDRTALVMDCGEVGILTCTWDGDNFKFIWASQNRKISYKDVK